MSPYAVDRSAVEAEAARRNAIRQSGLARWFIGKLAVSLVAFYALAFAVNYSSASRRVLSSMPLWSAVLMLALPALMALVATYVATRMIFDDEGCDPDRLMARVIKDVDSLTGPRWPLHVLWLALGLIVGVALPLALLRALRIPMVLPGSVQPLGLPQILVATLVWAIVMAFVIRFLALYVYRKMLRPVAASPESAQPQAR